jgi:hypothetical protein
MRQKKLQFKPPPPEEKFDRRLNRTPFSDLNFYKFIRKEQAAHWLIPRHSAPLSARRCAAYDP